MKRLITVVLLILACSAAATAADRDVDAVVNAIEQQYGMHHTNLPWIARAFIKPALWGTGAKLNMKLFEGQPLPASTSLQSIEEVTRKALDPSWRPFIQANSTRDHEKTVIYAKGDGKHMFLMIVAADREDTTVVKLKLDTSETRRWMDEPQEHAGHHGEARQEP